jgi:hypothetical protein
VASPPAERADAGYATASAIAVSAALAMIASAMAGLSAAELKSARGDLARLKAEAALGGAQQLAVVGILESSQQTRLRWTLQTDAGTADVLAEPEAAKIGFEQAAKLPASQLGGLGVVDLDALRDRLAAAAGPESEASAAGLDDGPVWKACAPSLVSYYGTSKALALAKPQAPDRRAFDWRAGAVWRIRTAMADGWADDRLVRFTGDPGHPAAIIERSFSREGTADRQCDTLFARG